MADIDLVQKIASMDLKAKVGQLFMLAFGGKDPGRPAAMIARHSLGGCYVSDANASTPEEAAALSEALQRGAIAASGVPLLLGVDQEGAWGVMMPASTTGPGNLGLGAAHDPELTRRMYKVMGEELAAVGYNTLLAPCVDVNSNPLNPIIGMRSFGARVDEVCAHAAAAVRGAAEAGVVTTVKHFPGHGNTAQDSHRGIPRVDRGPKALDEVDFPPFAAGIAAGADIVMTSHILYPALDPENPATLSGRIVGDLLRGKMGFEGLVLSDSMNMRAMRRNYEPGAAAARAIAAGVDMIMLAEEHYDHDAERYEAAQAATIEGVLEAVRAGTLDEGRIDEAAYRVLALKKRRNLLALARAPKAPQSVGSAGHRAVAEEASARLVCLLRGRAGTWPLPSGAKTALVRLAPLGAYAILTATRGIGPNQDQPAFDAFRDEFLTLSPGATVLDFHDPEGEPRLDPASLRAFDAVLAVSEDYPLPGVDFDTERQRRAVQALCRALGPKLAVVGLRTPYELADYQDLETYVSTCSSRPCAAVAAARAALGRIPSAGLSPV